MILELNLASSSVSAYFVYNLFGFVIFFFFDFCYIRNLLTAGEHRVSE